MTTVIVRQNEGGLLCAPRTTGWVWQTGIRRLRMRDDATSVLPPPWYCKIVCVWFPYAAIPPACQPALLCLQLSMHRHLKAVVIALSLRSTSLSPSRCLGEQ